jgi:predicted DNA-binding transcriptional regulator YafY
VPRSDRLRAIEDELGAAAPDPRTAQQLADRFGVSRRTIERDVEALQRAGVPVWTVPGPRGGFTIDAGERVTVVLTRSEAAAVATALAGRPLPLAPAATTAQRAVVSALAASADPATAALGERLTTLPPPAAAGPLLARLLDRAVIEGEILAVTHRDGTDGTGSTVEVEAATFAASAGGWHLVAWDRAAGVARSFDLDAVTRIVPTGLTAPPRGPGERRRLADLVRELGGEGD